LDKSVSMVPTADGKVKVSVGDKSSVCPDYISAAEWAESILYGEVEDE